MLALVPRKLKRWQDDLLKSIEEMREDFMMAVKKAIVDYVLRDPAFSESIVSEFESPERRELKLISSNWRPSIIAAHAKLEKTLHVTNPCLAALLDLWYVHFR